LAVKPDLLYDDCYLASLIGKVVDSRSGDAENRILKLREVLDMVKTSVSPRSQELCVSVFVSETHTSPGFIAHVERS
jgi:hypothetical protein